jgi:DNA polymerase III subunit gamma/tau
MEGMFKTKKFPSSLLISGLTGSGKTTLAYIFARRINCEKGTLCGKCLSCQFGEKHPDIVYHNAGTHGKVEDVRKLVQGAGVAPVTRKRVIIVDEAHKLTGASLNALLIPTESAPKNTIWIFCTTEPEKIDGTLSNRCVRLNLKPIAHETIVERLAEICEKEGFAFAKTKDGKNALNMIASISNGSLRDAVAHLEALSFAAASGKSFDSKGSLTQFVVEGSVDLEKASVDMVAAILDVDLASAIAQIRKANNPRGLISKARWLVDFLIGVRTKTVKFTPYSGRLFKQDHPDTKTPLPFLVMLQSTLVEAELRMNSCAIDENVILSTAVGNLVLEAKG